jgi:hypothetical protein
MTTYTWADLKAGITDALSINLSDDEKETLADADGGNPIEKVADGIATAIFNYMASDTTEIVLTMEGTDVESQSDGDKIAKIEIDGP